LLFVFVYVSKMRSDVLKYIVYSSILQRMICLESWRVSCIAGNICLFSLKLIITVWRLFICTIYLGHFETRNISVFVTTAGKYTCECSSGSQGREALAGLHYIISNFIVVALHYFLVSFHLLYLIVAGAHSFERVGENCC